MCSIFSERTLNQCFSSFKILIVSDSRYKVELIIHRKRLYLVPHEGNFLVTVAQGTERKSELKIYIMCSGTDSNTHVIHLKITYPVWVLCSLLKHL